MEARLEAAEVALRTRAVLSPTQKTFLCVWDLADEVDIGGFDQYFYDLLDAPDAPAALELIGAHKTAQIVREAVSLVNRSGLDWADEPARRDVLASLKPEAQDKLAAIDERFHAHPDDLTALLYRFVTKHPVEFRPQAR